MQLTRMSLWQSQNFVSASCPQFSWTYVLASGIFQHHEFHLHLWCTHVLRCMTNTRFIQLCNTGGWSVRQPFCWASVGHSVVVTHCAFCDSIHGHHPRHWVVRGWVPAQLSTASMIHICLPTPFCCCQWYTCLMLMDSHFWPHPWHLTICKSTIPIRHLLDRYHICTTHGHSVYWRAWLLCLIPTWTRWHCAPLPLSACSTGSPISNWHCTVTTFMHWWRYLSPNSGTT